MKINALVAAVVAVSIGSSGFVFAKDKGDRDDRGRNERADRGGNSERRDEGRRPEQREYNGRGPDGRGPPGQRKKEERREGGGAGPQHSYYPGDRLPMEYRHRSYVVDDWRDHRLSAPPRGYHWVQTGGDYVLIAIATGIIVQLLLNH